MRGGGGEEGKLGLQDSEKNTGVVAWSKINSLYKERVRGGEDFHKNQER